MAAVAILLVAGISPFTPLRADGEKETPAEEADAQAPRRSTVQIAGRVVDERGEPVAGAKVVAHVLRSRLTVETAADGSFKLDAPADQVVGLMLQATRDGAARQAYHMIKEPPKPGAAALTVRLILRPARKVVANVVDADKRPVAGAKVAALAYYRKFAEAVTDATGRVTLHVPSGAPLQYVLARKPKIGLDYFVYRRPSEAASDPYKLAADHSDPLTLVLDGARTVSVRVVGADDRPVPGVKVYPWYFNKPKKGDDLNLSGIVSDFGATTDARGIATFRTVPTDNSGKITFWVVAEGYVTPERPIFDPKSKATELAARLVPLVTVSGHVAFPDGRPAVDVEVRATGEGFQFDSFRGSTRTGKDGSYQIRVYPDQYCLFAAGRGEWVAPCQARIVREGKPVDGVDFVLQPATRVHGRLTIGDDLKPLAKTRVSLYQKGPDYYQLPESDRLPNPKDSRKGISPVLVRSVDGDEQGGFEFFVGPGRYYIVGPANFERPQFEITDQKDYRVIMHAWRRERGRIEGRVVLKDDPDTGVAEVAVTGYAFESTRAPLGAVTDAEGRFAAQRHLTEMLVCARNADHSLAGIVKIGADDEKVVLPVAPTASAHGRLIDAAGKPLANRQIDYGVHMQFTDGTFAERFGGAVTTDAKGEFTAKGLVVGREYVLDLVTERDADGQPRSWRQAGTTTCDRAGTVEIGDVKMKAR